MRCSPDDDSGVPPPPLTPAEPGVTPPLPPPKRRSALAGVMGRRLRSGPRGEGAGLRGGCWLAPCPPGSSCAMRSRALGAISQVVGGVWALGGSSATAQRPEAVTN